MATLTQTTDSPPTIDPLIAKVAQIPEHQTRTPTWAQKIAAQGPWDEDDLSDPSRPTLDGPKSLPMPVKVSDEESLGPFFRYLESNTAFEGGEGSLREPYYDTDMLEFHKGVVYVDGRMDLCKMVVGPPNISALMKSLEPNTHVKHFLLGNNIIGPAGARAIATFSSSFPNRMQTWYLAGNCLGPADLHLLTEPFRKSEVLHSLWLKRNPLGPKSVNDLAQLIIDIPTLRTLDLDLTELGDEGVANLFSLLHQHISNPENAKLGLRHIYLNANGISTKACISISSYLSLPTTNLESLFLSCNPLGDKGCIALSPGVASNKSLKRLTLASCGIKTPGAKAILTSSLHHPTLEVLNLGQSYATKDLGQRYNWLTDPLGEDIIYLLTTNEKLRLLNFGLTAFTHPIIEGIVPHAAASQSLCSYTLDSIIPAINRKDRPHLKKGLNASLEKNVKRLYGDELTKEEFEAGPHLRFLRNTEDVRFIDSVYRNRDAWKARRKLGVLEKWWDEGDGTLEGVVNA